MEAQEALNLLGTATASPLWGLLLQRLREDQVASLRDSLLALDKGDYAMASKKKAEADTYSKLIELPSVMAGEIKNKLRSPKNERP